MDEPKDFIGKSYYYLWDAHIPREDFHWKLCIKASRIKSLFISSQNVIFEMENGDKYIDTIFSDLESALTVLELRTKG